MEALPSSHLGQRLCQTFSYRWNVIEALNEDSTSKPRWRTNTKHPIKARVLWAKYQDAGQLIGTRFGSSTEYALIDVDAQSAYLGQTEKILSSLETIGICRTVVLRSSYSGGLHIYIPLPKRYPTFSVAVAVAQALEAQGFQLGAGQLEVFPNIKSYACSWKGEFSDYQAHRLPLQPATGSWLLDSNLEPITGGDSLSRFFALWDNALLFQDEHAIDEAIAVARNNRRRRRQSVGPVAEWRADLELVLRDGWTGFGQTNAMLKNIGCYGRVFLGLAGVELAEWMERFATNSPGFDEFCRHKHEIWKRCCLWGAAVEKYYWPLGSNPTRQRRTLADVCQERANDCRDRIAAAVGQLAACGQTVKQMVIELCKLARCSPNSLYKHRDLWHPQGAAPADQPTEGVTAQPASAPGPLGAILAEINASLEQADLAWVTGLGGGNERLGAGKPPQKSFNSGSGGGVARGGGFPQGDQHG